MRIAHFSDHFFHSQPQGLWRYAHELRAGLVRSDIRVHTVGTWSNLGRCHLEDLKAKTESTLLPGKRRYWASWWHVAGVPRLETLIGSHDVVHFLSPGYRVPTSMPTVLTIHDLGLHTHPEFFSGSFSRLVKRHINDVLRRNGRIIVPSKTVADECLTVLGRADVEVVPEGASRPVAAPNNPSSAVQSVVEAGPFFLVVGSINPRKNIDRTLDAFLSSRAHALGAQLVVVGGAGWDCESTVSRLQTTAGVVWLADVSDDDLWCLYARAVALLFVSLYEGFGLPAVEAMAAGCPVIASAGTAVGEAVDDAGIRVDPLRREAIRAAIDRIYASESLRETLAGAGEERSRLYSWERAAAQTAEIYRMAAA